MLKIVITEWDIHPHFGGENVKQTDFSLDEAPQAQKYWYSLPTGVYQHKSISIVEIGCATLKIPEKQE